MAKVLVAYADAPHFASHGYGANGYLALIEPMLKNLGYELDILVMEENAALYTTLVTSKEGYDFAIVFRGIAMSGTGHLVSKLLGGLTTIPVFHLYNTEVGAFSYYGSGLEAGDAVGYKVCTFNGFSIPLYVRTRTPSAAQGFDRDDYEVLITADDYTIDNIVAARYKSAASSVYVTAEGSQAGCTLPIMMQHCVNRGEMPAPPRKGLVMQDIDDFPAALNTQSELSSANNIQQQYGMPITYGIHAADLSDHADSVWAWLEGNSVVNGGLIYPIEHQGGTFWNDTKANIDAMYRLHVSNMQGKGITTGRDVNGLDSFGYHFFNTNRINDFGLQLATTDTSYLSSSDNATKKAGYGFRAVRMTPGDHSGGGGQGQEWSPLDQMELCLKRNMLVCEGTDYITDSNLFLTLAANTDRFAVHVIANWINSGIAFNQVCFLHGSNFYDGHDGGNAPGLTALTIGGNIVNYCSDVMKFAHPSELADRVGVAINSMHPDG